MARFNHGYLVGILFLSSCLLPSIANAENFCLYGWKQTPKDESAFFCLSDSFSPDGDCNHPPDPSQVVWLNQYDTDQSCKSQQEAVAKAGFCSYGEACISALVNSEKCIGQSRYPTLSDCVNKADTLTLEEKRYTDIVKDLKPPQPSIRIPGIQFSDVQRTLDADGNISVPWIGEYISGIYKLAMGLGSIVAVILIIQQGITIVISGGGEMKTEAYQKIGKIFLGLGILWGSYAILYTINPDLVNFKILKIKFIEEKKIVVDAADEPATTGSGAPQVGNQNVPYFAQWEGPWAKMKPGDAGWPAASGQEGRTDCTTIQQRGCGPTSLAMVLAFYGQNVTPLDTAKWGLGCTGAWQPSTIKSGWPWTSLTGKVIKKTEILGLLKQGKPIVFNCAPCTGLNKDGLPGKTYKGHYVVLTGYLSDNKIGVNDPGANPTKRIMSMTPDEVLSSFNTAVYVDKKSQ